MRNGIGNVFITLLIFDRLIVVDSTRERIGLVTHNAILKRLQVAELLNK